MRTEMVTTTLHLDAVVAEWERLWQVAGAGVFQSHGWIAAWWAEQDPSSRYRLHVALCWQAERLVAIIPCVTRIHRGLRILEWAGKDCSDYCDAIVDPLAPGALQAAWQALVAAGGFHAIYLNHVRTDAAIATWLAATPGRLRRGTRNDITLQVRSGGQSGAGWFRTLPKKARNNHTRGKRILAEFGALAIGPVQGAAATATIEQMVAFKQQWLAATGQRNALLADGARGLRRMIAALQQTGACDVLAITCNGAFVAGLVNITGRGMAASYFSAFDPKFERASPGTIAIVEHVMAAFDRGIPVVDFLCGDEPYKFKFANAETELGSYVGARTPLGRAALAGGEWVDRRKATRLPGLEDARSARPAGATPDFVLAGARLALNEPRRVALRAALTDAALLDVRKGQPASGRAARTLDHLRRAAKLPGAVAANRLGGTAAVCALYRTLCRETTFLVFVGEPPGRLSRLDRWVLRVADGVLVDGDAAARAVSSPTFLGAPVYRIAPRYALEPFLQVVLRPIPARRTIVVAGELGPKSGAAGLLSMVMAWAQANPRQAVSLCWLGEGDLSRVLAAQPLPPNVFQTFAGRPEAEALPAIFGQAEMLLAAAATGNRPILVAEGLAAGLPVLGSRRNADVRHFITDGVNGWLFDSASPHHLLAALTRVLATPDAALEEMRGRARATITAEPACSQPTREHTPVAREPLAQPA